MSGALLTVEGISCQVCGGVRAKRGPNDLMCYNCWERFQYFRGRTKSDLPEEEEIARWLARQLFLDVRRLKQTGVTGRCEAVSNFLYGNRGYQCAQRATLMQDGHRVCPAHFKKGVAGYIHEKASDPYEVLAGMMCRIVKVDARFAEMLLKIANGIKPATD